MPALSEKHISILGPLISPFERSQKKPELKVIGKGEGHKDAFLDKIHDGIDNHNPEPFHEITVKELEDYNIMKGGSFPDKCYLWVIDEISIKIIWEKTMNSLRGEAIPHKPYVCHTNITGGARAYLGGEIYFCQDGNIYVNFKSDRYGWPDTELKKQMALTYMEDCGYRNLVMTTF